MHPFMISAQFAAFVWFTERRENAGKSADDALQFARDHWKKFRPLAHHGLGRLLLKMSGRRRRPRTEPSAAVPACAQLATSPGAAHPDPDTQFVTTSASQGLLA